MEFHPDLIPAVLQRRYKRFLADVTLNDGTTVTVHCPNTGAMMGCQEPGSRVWLSTSDNLKRKYRHTWELVEARPQVLVGINTARTNALAFEALETDKISQLAGFDSIRKEVHVGERSRIDFLLEYPGGNQCFLEVKNVTAAVEEGIAAFPDAVSQRATRHLNELMTLVQGGHRGALLFIVQREDVHQVRPADEIDPQYGETLRLAKQRGVEIYAYRASVSRDQVRVEEEVAVDLSKRTDLENQ
ncbi:MAG: DNA/RNA nuclease SfsA [Pseudomonadota bacterium]